MIRKALGAIGALVGVYGAYLLLTRQDLDQLVNAALWLFSGVVLHDFVLTPVVLLLFLVAARLLPTPARAPAVVGIVVLGAVTLVAIPVLTGFGERPDNPTLDDRNYGVGWLVVAGLTLLCIVVASVLRSRRPTPEGSPHGPRPGRR